MPVLRYRDESMWPGWRKQGRKDPLGQKFKMGSRWEEEGEHII